MAKYTEIELIQEIEHLKQQLRERERERESRIVDWCFLMVNSFLTRANLSLCSEIKKRSQIRYGN
ncbi:MAG: hypothetical protein I3273_06705 [Candidatus Moeniiplasma glomeromycotorum]|nr:hypothetical protein [Candidatus Moeniiplasma glomeromycotorum]